MFFWGNTHVFFRLWTRYNHDLNLKNCWEVRWKAKRTDIGEYTPSPCCKNCLVAKKCFTWDFSQLYSCLNTYHPCCDLMLLTDWAPRTVENSPWTEITWEGEKKQLEVSQNLSLYKTFITFPHIIHKVISMIWIIVGQTDEKKSYPSISCNFSFHREYFQVYGNTVARTGGSGGKRQQWISVC